MPRFARTVNVITGEETLVPFSPAEAAAADAGTAEELANPRPTTRDPLAEIDALKTRITTLEASTAAVL